MDGDGNHYNNNSHSTSTTTTTTPTTTPTIKRIKLYTIHSYATASYPLYTLFVV
jgi:hypothetical protein